MSLNVKYKLLWFHGWAYIFGAMHVVDHHCFSIWGTSHWNCYGSNNVTGPVVCQGLTHMDVLQSLVFVNVHGHPCKLVETIYHLTAFKTYIGHIVLIKQHLTG